MFVSQESNKRRFQKPNILRRRTKAPVRLSGVPNVSSSTESRATRSDASVLLQGTKINNLQLQNITKYTSEKPNGLTPSVQKESIQSNVLHRQIETKYTCEKPNGLTPSVQKDSIQSNVLHRQIETKYTCEKPNGLTPSVQKGSIQSNVLHRQIEPKYTCEKPNGLTPSVQKGSIQSNVLHTQIETIDLKQHSQCFDNETCSLVNIVNYSEENPVQSSVNVESFFNNGVNRENVIFTIDRCKEIQSIVIIDKEFHENSVSSQPSMVPLSAVSRPSIKAQIKEQKETTTTVVSPQQLFENTTLSAIKFKCDFPGCKKQFRSEQKYKRHKNSHKKEVVIRESRQVTLECPVKKVDSNGTEQRCGKIYLVREQLAKHLSEDHTPEEAPYRCEQCGRQFFWATGLRAHARSHSASRRAAPALACGWPGCGRVFAVPCRLREHARTHTGDKPYSCRFPGCNSAFRSASKLERHARRHTGVRRHACACGRAYLRREHLRDHAARHHAAAPQPLTCVREECGQSLEEEDGLQEHLNTSHKAKELAAPAADSLLTDNLDYVWVEVANGSTQEIEEKGDEAGGDIAEEAVETDAEADSAASLESCAARTHCPWPLAARCPPHYVLEEDAAVEQAEGSESNIYTVRSDLFLHGNVLINEDSVQMGSAVENAEVATETSAPNDELGLGLLEHPHIDLMQEEMMFTAWQ